MNFKTFESKSKSEELDAFDLLKHVVSILDATIQYELKKEDPNVENLLLLSERMLDCSDRLTSIVLGLMEGDEDDRREPENKNPIGFQHPTVDSISTPDSEPGGLQ